MTVYLLVLSVDAIHFSVVENQQ